jgi:hypothetical protein
MLAKKGSLHMPMRMESRGNERLEMSCIAVAFAAGDSFVDYIVGIDNAKERSPKQLRNRGGASRRLWARTQ